MRIAALAFSLSITTVLAAQTVSRPAIHTAAVASPAGPLGSGRSNTAKPTVRYKPDIAASTPIFTLEGVCQPPAKGAKPEAECKTIVTRGQLDVMLAALDPEASPKAHQQFALSYARLIAATNLAEKRHLDKDPTIAREIEVQQSLARMQVLTNHVLQGLQIQASRIPDNDVDAYYKKNKKNFEQADVRRIAVPLNAITESGQPLNASVVKAKMDELRDRAIKGDDFDALQERAYKELDIKGGLPRTSLSISRRQIQSPAEAHVFELDQGEISAVIENQDVVLILRLDAKRELTLEQARPQIEATLQLQSTVDELTTAFKGVSADFNLKYMEAASQPELFPASVVTQNQFRRSSGLGRPQ